MCARRISMLDLINVYVHVSDQCDVSDNELGKSTVQRGRDKVGQLWVVVACVSQAQKTLVTDDVAPVGCNLTSAQHPQTPAPQSKARAMRSARGMEILTVSRVFSCKKSIG